MKTNLVSEAEKIVAQYHCMLYSELPAAAEKKRKPQISDRGLVQGRVNINGLPRFASLIFHHLRLIVCRRSQSRVKRKQT